MRLFSWLCGRKEKRAERIQRAPTKEAITTGESLKSQKSLDKEYIIPWGEAYDRVCLPFAAFDDRWKCGKYVRIQCSDCGRTFSFSQLMDVGALASFGGFVGVSTRPINSAMVGLAQKDPSSWRCPYCSSGNVTFGWLGEDRKDLLRFRLKLSSKLKTDQG